MRHDLRARVSGAVGALGACSRHIVYRAAAALIVLVVLLVGGVLWAYWSSLYRDVQARSGTLAFLLAEQTTRTFQAVDLTLAGLEPMLDTVPAWPDHAPAVEKLLAQRVSELDFIHAIYVVDAEGEVTQSSGDETATVAGAAVRPYFDEFRRRPDAKILVGQPLFGRPGRLSAIPVLRRLSTPAGDFDGVVVASVEPRYFSDFYRNVDLGRRGTIDLYQDNGSILLASTGDAPALPLAATASFDLALPLGDFRTSGRIADQRLIAFHRAAPYPLVVAVGFDLNDLWRRWWHIAAPSILATLAIAVLVWTLAVTVVRRLAERRRAQSRAVMVQKLEALGQMTASVSHDFRNLLAVMASTLGLVRRRGPDESVLRAAEEALERGDKLITQLLAFSKRHDLQLRPASINALLDGLDGVLRHAAGRGVSLVFDKAEGLPLCRADQAQFDAALMNLVVNARQAMPEGGRVTIATRPAGGRGVELTVADTGVGIAPGDLKRVFEPFFTTKADAGTGLGLAQVYGFMRRIGGDVAVASRPGAGTTVTLLFPLAGERPETEAARPAA